MKKKKKEKKRPSQTIQENNMKNNEINLKANKNTEIGEGLFILKRQLEHVYFCS